MTRKIFSSNTVHTTVDSNLKKKNSKKAVVYRINFLEKSEQHRKTHFQSLGPHVCRTAQWSLSSSHLRVSLCPGVCTCV